MSRRLVDDHAAVGEGQAGGNAQLVGEDGELVGLAVAVGVLENDDPVVALALGLHVVGVVDGHGDPEPAAWSQFMQIGLPPSSFSAANS